MIIAPVVLTIILTFCVDVHKVVNTFYNDRTSNVPLVVIYIKIFKFPNKIKNKKSYTAQTVLRSISQTTERGKIDPPYAQIHNRPLPWLGTSNSIINEGLN